MDWAIEGYLAQRGSWLRARGPRDQRQRLRAAQLIALFFTAMGGIGVCLKASDNTCNFVAAFELAFSLIGLALTVTMLGKSDGRCEYSHIGPSDIRLYRFWASEIVCHTLNE
ncbi:hypothetical protein PENANT_c001G06055 [Penicillium antarcticum]|uniref:Uncharacterized protein n=1 Tax=Penicillium antarcticum TaxID=416450 RepID=A0A1V6QNP9_9EURO|nr:hypothetical protein PENANT_c001G06055 [Penicillium antarcticum]